MNLNQFGVVRGGIDAYAASCERVCARLGAIRVLDGARSMYAYIGMHTYVFKRMLTFACAICLNMYICAYKAIILCLVGPKDIY